MRIIYQKKKFQLQLMKEYLIEIISFRTETYRLIKDPVTTQLSNKQT